MKVVKKSQKQVLREDAHGGSGGRRLYLDKNEVKNVQGLTYGYLPSGNMFAWHNHEDVNEIMLCLKGHGTVRDEDGTYEYKEGDFFIFPKGVFHEIKAEGNIENEFVFVRVFDL